MRLIGEKCAYSLTENETAMLCTAINTFPSESGGPYAEIPSLPFFTREFAREAVTAIKPNLTGRGLAVADSIITKLEG